MVAASLHRSKLLAFVVVLMAFIGTARAETLQDALTEAYETNPQLLSERAHLRAVDEGVPQALSNWRPTMQFTGAAGAERTTHSPTCPH